MTLQWMHAPIHDTNEPSRAAAPPANLTSPVIVLQDCGISQRSLTRQASGWLQPSTNAPARMISAPLTPLCHFLAENVPMPPILLFCPDRMPFFFFFLHFPADHGCENRPPPSEEACTGRGKGKGISSTWKLGELGNQERGPPGRG